MSDVASWSNLDGAVYSSFCSSKHSTIHDRVSCLQDCIYKQATNLFGFLPPPKKRLSFKPRRTQNCILLIIEKNSLLAQISSASFLEKPALLQLLNHVKQKIRCLRRSEKGRKKRWRRKKASSAFFKNPYEAGKKLLNPSSSEPLHVDKACMDAHKAASANDLNYKIPLTDLEGLPSAPLIKIKIPDSLLQFYDFECVESRKEKFHKK